MIKVCAYCRVSTDSTDQVNSFENQQSYFNRELSKNPDYKLVNIYADKGISGTKLHRTEFDKMLVDAGLEIIKVSNESGYLKYITLPTDREPKFKYIYVKNSSRFARNVEVESIFRDLAKKGVYVIFLDLMKSTENESDRTYIQIFSSFDERESRDKRTKVLFGIKEGNKKGVIRTNKKIYGYKYIQSENRLEVIEEEAEVIRKIFKLYNQNLGIRRIINKLNEENIKTRQGKNFCKNAISQILDNEKYFGVSNNCKYKIGNDLFDKFTYAKRKEDNEYELKETSKIPAIISSDDFYKAREIRRAKINHENQKGIKKPTSKYSGVIFCGNCNEVYTSNVDDGRKFYNCKSKKMYGLKRCANPNVSERIIDKKIEEFFETLPDDLENFFSDRIKETYSFCRLIIENEPANFEKVKELKNEEKQLLSQLDELYDLYSKKKGTQDFLERKIESLEKRIMTIQEKISDLSIDDDYVINKVKRLLKEIDKFNTKDFKFNSADDIIPHIRIVVESRNEIIIEFKFIEEILKFWSNAHTIFKREFDEDLFNQHHRNIDEYEKTKEIVDEFLRKQGIVS